jgi:HEAT repeat protein
MFRLGLLLALLAATAAFGEGRDYATRAEALQALDSSDAEQRAEALAWIAGHGTPADAALLQQRLRDDNPYVRDVAERALWQLWSHSGDAEVDALLIGAVGADRDQRGDRGLVALGHGI